MDPNVTFKSPKHSPYSHRQNETLVAKPGTLNGTEITLTNLLNCEVFILDHTSVVVVENCSNSKIRIGPVAGFCHLRSCVGCTVSVAARDVELNRCTAMTLYVYSANNPHIENTSGLVIAPYNFSYPLQDHHFKKAGLAAKSNSWDQITDHTADERLNNWGFLPLQDCEDVKYEIESLGRPVNPVPRPKADDAKPHGGARKEHMFHQQSPKAFSNADDPVPEDAPVGLTDISLGKVPGKDNSYVPDVTTHNITDIEHGELVRILYTRDEEFVHEFSLPYVGVNEQTMLATLQKASRVAGKFHDDMDLLTIGELSVLAAALVLALIAVLLHIFTELYGAGLAIELVLVTGAFVALEAVLLRKHSLLWTQGNLELRKLLEYETRAVYSAQGVEVRGNLGLLEVVVGSVQ